MSIVNIFINGKECKADTEKTLLDNILDNGINLPHLCHNPEIESYGGCGLCLVMVEGINKPLRACSTTVTEGMKVTTSTEALEKSRKVSLSLILSDHSGDCKAPCFKACPTHQDIQAYVGLIANGETEEAIKIIKKDNPLPRSIGRVCPHPCEDACRRNHLEGAVSICSLKRFAGDEYSDYIPECEEKNGKKVAVVGGGPAGLSCAYFLLLKGYSVEVFEAEKKAGGMLRFGIPAYRLPKDVLDKEIENIEKMGAHFNYNKKLGRDFTVESLKADFDAVFIATGAWKSSSLRCEGDDASGVIGGIDMLYKVANGENIDIGKNVAVVGGGNTAIDAVRTAVRLGAENVTLIYRRTESEMPAEKDEIKDAKEEGVNFKFLVAPLNVVTENGKVKGINLQKMELGEPDASGRRSPIAIEGETEILYCDTIISAIGQQVVSSDVKELELTKKGTISADECTFKTSVDGVFAAGDVINKGPDIAVRAIAGGKNAARSIDCYLNGIELIPELPQYAENKDFDKETLCGTVKQDRVSVTLENADVRKNNFNEVASVLTKEEAQKEASRCLECGCASVYDCQLLPLMREYDSWEMNIKGKTRQYKKDKSHPFIVRDNNKCILCGLCVRVCNEVSHTENLGLFGRGFGTIPMSAFDLPLGESNCVSCGACVNTCPTGALTSRTPTVKNIVLPYLESKVTCKGCENACEFTKRTINGKTVKMMPDDLRKSCSVGVFGLVAVENSQDESIISYIKGDLRNYNGDKNALNTLKSIEKLLK
ncbi:MAG: 2Fe-2S iron-sulfur cluster binding domain-containing protein [Ruminococcaceae bacterium]|nr:2Fe-2S iron-sulfur cluster binding domain-containing protein [Oscillospiraceae bacterium]